MLLYKDTAPSDILLLSLVFPPQTIVCLILSNKCLSPSPYLEINKKVYLYLFMKKLFLLSHPPPLFLIQSLNVLN